MDRVPDQYILRNRHLAKYPHSHFFDSDTLKFFGETMSSMNVLKSIVNVKDSCDEWHECYVLSSLQRKAPGGARRVYHYFDTQTYEHIIN